MKFPDSSFPDSHIKVKKMVTRFLQRNQLQLAIVIIALINVALHLGFYNTLGFHRDELLYFFLGRHLSAGYASVPPLTGFLACLIISDIKFTGGITDPLAREYGTKVYLCTHPVKSFNQFWMERYPQVKSPF
jgi:hypothetical protein